MNAKNILDLFDGLSAQQAKEFIRLIPPALEALRREVTKGDTPQGVQMQAKPQKPMTKAEMQEKMDRAIRYVMSERKVNYAAAFEIIQNEKPGVIAGYSTVMQRSK